MVDGVAVDRKRFLASAIEPHIQYHDDERDVVIVRIDVKGSKGSEKKRIIHQVIDRRDLRTGFTAMSRTVGYTTSIGALMIGTGAITKRGVLSPVKDIPYGPFVQELERRDIQIISSSLTCT
jgi:lysine 6-dehydrogenase